MSDQLTYRLNKIIPTLTSDNFLKARGIGNEIAFYIFDYAPEDELRIRDYIRFLLEHLKKIKPNLRVVHVNLFDFLIQYLKDRSLLEKSYQLQREKGNDELLKALKGVLHEEKIAQRFAKVTEPVEQDLVLISGIGSVYPLLRSHTLLSNLHALMGQTPLVLFYPGRYDSQTLRLFGKIGLTGGPGGEGKKQTNYYRAFKLID